MDNSNDAIKALANISKISMANFDEYSLDKETSWLKEILIELNANADDKDELAYLDETSIELELKLKKKFKGSLGEYVIAEGNLKSEYVTQCVRTLQEMREQIEVSINSCFIDKIHEKEEAYADQLEIFDETKLYDLYFYEKKQVNLKSMIHEQVFLNMNQYPVKDHDAPLYGEGQSETKN